MTDPIDLQATIEERRARYEQLRQAGQQVSPRALPGKTPRILGTAGRDIPVSRTHVSAGWYWSGRIARGETIRIVNTSGRATVSMLAWNERDPSERLNHADTIKVQWAANICKGRVLLSDMGRVILSVVEDTCGRHDVLAGGSTPDSVGMEAGVALRNTRDNFVAAVGKLGLGPRDIHPCIAFFAPVTILEGGRLAWEDGIVTAGDFVDLRAEMDVLMALSNCPHPLDRSIAPDPGEIELMRFRDTAPGPDDLCRTASPESARAFENTDSYLGERP